MNIHGFNWDDRNKQHIALHNVTPDEVEEAFQGKYITFPSWAGRYILLSRSAAGRYLFIVFEIKSGIVRTVTARTMSGTEKRRYQKGK
ncbi:MAG: BrnT family toxin [Candidatus Omnitrophica bacterium]|nr:BrnT family toxin [Candidatus Omnitrophota bacterium]